MGYTVEHDCPQCGAPVDLDEADRLLKCPYCDVTSYLCARDYAHLVLPPRTGNGNILYVPYLRFKGNVFQCRATAINHRIVDITRLGIDYQELPASLGVRPQTVKMKFAGPSTAGEFLRCDLHVEDVLDTVNRHMSTYVAPSFFHRAYIGETVSRIYLPLYIRENALYDALADRFIIRLSDGGDVFSPFIDKNPRWQITFMPTICPECGWNLTGERDSVVLTCSNCHAAWDAGNGRFKRRRILSVRGTGRNTLYVPFWKIKARTSGLDIRSYADFIRVTNQPRVVQGEWEREDMWYWIPAFKIRPDLFLQLCRQMTVTQRKLDMVEELPEDALYPVTLPHSEAVQGLKITLAHSMIRRKMMFPNLPQTHFTVEESEMVYLPFTDTGQEVFQEHFYISLSKKTLEFARQL